MSAGRQQRYEAIFHDIKALHSKLYADPAFVRKIRRGQQRTYSVVQPLRNLLPHHEHELPLQDRTLRVLLALPWFDLGGSSVIKREVFSRLQDRGVQVTAVATDPSGGHHTENGLPLYESFTNDCFNLIEFLEEGDKLQFIDYLIRSRQITVLLVAGSRPVYEMLPILKKRFPSLVVIDELYNVVGHVASNREFQRFIDRNIVITEEIKDHLQALGEDTSRICVIPTGVDTSRFDPTNPEFLSHVDKRPYKEFTFGFLGRLSPEKRPLDFVRLASQLSSCQFRMCGDGSIASMVQEEVLSCKVSNRIHLEGVTENPLAFFAGIDTLVLPSDVEGLPFVLLEAMALEIPVIATAVGGIPEVVSHGHNGFLYHPGRVDELIHQAEMLAKMPETDRKDIGRQARETVLRAYRIEDCTDKYMKCFAEVMKNTA